MAATVHAAARQDYLAGLSYIRRRSGVDAALPLLEHAVAADPDSPLTHAALAEAQWLKYFLSNDQLWRDRTSESVRQAESRNPDLAQVHRVAGLLMAESGWYDQAAAEYRRAIELDPANSDAYRRLGMACQGNNQLDEALTAYRRAIEVEPGYYRNYHQLGIFYNKQANYTEAAKYLQKTVELVPDEPDAHYALGLVYMNSGRFAEAENELRLAIHLGETPIALHTLGVVLMYQGRDQDAIPYLLRALRVGPERYLWWMNLGIAYRRVNLTAESERANRSGLELAEAEMRKNPRRGYVRSFLAYLSARLGDRRRAESEVAQALQVSPNDADVRWMVVMTYEALGRREDTLAILSASPYEVLADLNRYPDLADLHKDSRFVQLLASHQVR
jgi:tetratricopeptide (TPR) repeat protein